MAGAVRLVLDEGKTIGAVSRDLDLTPSSLGNWVRHARADRTKGQTGLTTEERAELATLRKENRGLRMERDILKKPRPFSPSTRRNVRLDRRGEGRVPHRHPLSGHAGVAQWLLCGPWASRVDACQR
jgi:transposase